MKRRCDKPTCKEYVMYGGRGIRYDPAWSRFEAFYADMGDRPDGLSLDRIDNDGDYAKDNCRWADRLTQRMNQRPRSPQKPRKDKGIPRGHYAPRPRWRVNVFTTTEALLARLAGSA